MKRFCEGGIEIDDGPCRKCGAMPKDRCGSPGPITHSITLDALESYIASMPETEIWRSDIDAMLEHFRKAAGRESE